MTQKIKTSIHKTFSTGFVLNEADLRRMYQMMIEAAAKINEPGERSYFYVRTENGTIYELDSIDEIFVLDNIGPKLISFLALSVGNAVGKTDSKIQDKDQEWFIGLRFERLAEEYGSNAPSIQLHVVGRSRDWVVLTASELEERIKLICKFSLAKYFNQSTIPYVTLAIFISLWIGLFDLLVPSSSLIPIKLEEMRAAGTIKDAVDAIIELERLKEPTSLAKDAFLKWFIAGALGIGVLVAGMSKAVRFVRRPFVFLWGGYVGIHQRRKAVESVIVVVIVLGVIVGVISTWASRLLGI